MANRSMFPASEDTLLLFTAHLATEGILASTIKVYLSTIHSSHVAAGRHKEFSKQLTPRLQHVIKGIQKQQAITSPQRIRHPITIEILEGIHSILSKHPQQYHNIMMWVACCMAFFRFLRSSEFTVPSPGQFYHSIHLTLAYISLDS